MIKDAFELYLKYNGTRFDLIDKEMHQRGWVGFKANSRLKNRGNGDGSRSGWIERFGWKKSLEMKAALAGTLAATSAESLLFEVEEIRKKIFMELQTLGVGKGQKDLVYQHDKYVARTTEILDKLDRARDNYANFVFFIQHLLKAATNISPALAAALMEAEEALIEWAESEFTTTEDAEGADVRNVG